MRTIILGIFVIFIFNGCIGMAIDHYKMASDPNSNYNKKKRELRKHGVDKIHTNNQYLNVLKVSNKELKDNHLIIKLKAYRSKTTTRIGRYCAYYRCANKGVLKKKKKLLSRETNIDKYYDVNSKFVNVEAFIQDSECSIEKVNITYKFIGDSTVEFTIPNKYKNRYLGFKFETKNLKDNVETRSCNNCSKFIQSCSERAI